MMFRTQRRVWHVVATTLITVTFPAIPAAAQSKSPLRAVIIVRHGEKATEPKENPPLSPAGEARAQSLLEATRQAGITTIITTDQIRTRATAAPLLSALHLQGVVVPRSENPKEDAAAVAAAVRRGGGTVLVVGHQLTMPMVIAALGGPAVATMCDFEYSNMYILLADGSARLKLLRSHYGTPDPPRTDDCHITPVSPP